MQERYQEDPGSSQLAAAPCVVTLNLTMFRQDGAPVHTAKKIQE